MEIIKKLAVLALVSATVLAPSGADAKAKTKVITEACTKNLASGIYSYVMNFSSDYIIGPITFQEKSRDKLVARGVCTIHLKFQPPD
jgi:hypothetical protein